MNNEITPGDPIASLPEQEKRELGLLGPDGEPIKPKLGKVDMPENDEGLCAIQILGRCSKCKVTGWIDYPGGKIATSDVDKLLNYKAVKCFCAGCRAMAEFLPIAYKKYPDVPMLKNLQDGYRIGKVK